MTKKAKHLFPRPSVYMPQSIFPNEFRKWERSGNVNIDMPGIKLDQNFAQTVAPEIFAFHGKKREREVIIILPCYTPFCFWHWHTILVQFSVQHKSLFLLFISQVYFCTRYISRITDGFVDDLIIPYYIPTKWTYLSQFIALRLNPCEKQSNSYFCP